MTERYDSVLSVVVVVVTVAGGKQTVSTVEHDFFLSQLSTNVCCIVPHDSSSQIQIDAKLKRTRTI